MQSGVVRTTIIEVPYPDLVLTAWNDNAILTGDAADQDIFRIRIRSKGVLVTLDSSLI